MAVRAPPVERDSHADRPALFLNPAGDTDFATTAAALLDDGERSSLSFQRSLRVRFPDTVVHERDLSGESLEVWYVFRHGHWVGSSNAMG